jgi:hypothetical protein
MQALAEKLRAAMLLRAEETADLNDTTTISGFLEEQLNVSTLLNCLLYATTAAVLLRAALWRFALLWQ